jgi:methionine sulfoxide reductase catalytic subunit
MGTEKLTKPLPSEITPESTYLNRRTFMRTGMFAGSIAATSLAYKYFGPSGSEPAAAGNEIAVMPSEGSARTEEKTNTFEEITNYNNFYEFSTNKLEVAEEAKALVTRPWTVEVGGLVQKPRTFDIDDILKFPQEERIYRFRCVEAWSMVIPWIGFSLKRLLDEVVPLGTAKYVAFQSFYDSKIMQSSWSAGIDFPYVEGLRLDEASHPLTILATGLYGKAMPNQNGAPIRLVVPWKYGFKSIKSICEDHSYR